METLPLFTSDMTIRRGLIVPLDKAAKNASMLPPWLSCAALEYSVDHHFAPQP